MSPAHEPVGLESPLAPDAIARWMNGVSHELFSDASALAQHEDWIIDLPGEDFSRNLDDYAKAIETGVGWAGVLVDDTRDMLLFISVLAYTQIHRALRLLSLAAHRQPGLAGDVLVACEKFKRPGSPYEAESKAIYNRIRFLVERVCYRNIFGPERRKAVLEILSTMEGGNYATGDL